MAVSDGETIMVVKEMGLVTNAFDERKLAPLSTFVAGVHAGRLSASGVPRREALDRAVSVAAGLIPESADEAPG